MGQRLSTALVVTLAVPSAGWTCVQGPRASGRALRMSATDPTDSPLIGMINTLQEAIQTSPIATFKSKLAKLQAGDYDEASVKAKLDSMIADEPVVMFSFTT